MALRDETLAEIIRRKRMVGIACDSWRRYERPNSWNYEVTTQGYRYHLSNLNAAIGVAQLERMEVFQQRKQAIVRRYLQGFSDESRLVPLHWQLDESFPFAYVTRVLGGGRDGLLAHLKKQGVTAGVHYPLNHRQPYFQLPVTALPVTEALADEILTLPLYPDLTDQEISHVIDSVRGWERS